MQMENKALRIITGKGATLHGILILRLNVHNLLHRLSACLKDSLASIQGDRPWNSSPMPGSWFQNLEALWKAMNGHPCTWTLGSKSLVRTVCMGRSESRVSDWYGITCMLPVVGLCSGIFQNNGAQQLVGWTVRKVFLKNVYCFCKFLLFLFPPWKKST